VSYIEQELLTLYEHLGSSPDLYGIGVVNLFLLCVFVVCVVARWLVYNVANVGLDCSFLIAPSGLSNVYLNLVNLYNNLYCKLLWAFVCVQTVIF
jgi:hypothetical protein